jgi:type II secretory pathway component PulC
MVFASGCFLYARPRGAVKLSDVRPVPESRTEKQMTLSAEALLEALAKGNQINRIRIVPIFYRSSQIGESYPEYRLFEIQNGSIYERVGLRNGDVLVAADDYVVFTPDQFREYMRVFPRLENPSMEITRDGKPLLFKYTIVGRKDG